MMPYGGKMSGTVLAGMTMADGVNVILRTSCLPSADCKVWCRIVELYAALLLVMMLLTTVSCYCCYQCCY
jgi:hypothetical protein